MKGKFLPILILVSFHAVAQDSSFSLRNYKYRTPGYKALSIGLNVSGSASNSKTESQDETSSSYFRTGPFSIAYASVVSTDARLHESSITLSPLAYFSKQTANGKTSTYKSFQPNLVWERNDRFYKNNSWFLEVGNRLSTAFQTEKQKDSLYNYKNHQLQLTEGLTIGVGKGRIERVQDAQMALYLLHDLSAQGLLSKPATAEDAAKLARLITDINNRRIFDSRRRRIYELTRLDSFLRNSGLTAQTDIRHFTVINDNWAFAINPYRLSGANWYLRLLPSVQYNRSVNNYLNPTLTSTGKATSTTLGIGPVIGYENYLPLSLKWQRNFGFSASYFHNKNFYRSEVVYPSGVYKTASDTSEGKPHGAGFYGLGYFPNTRTQLMTTLWAEGDFYKGPILIWETYLSVVANYFLGYRTYLSANVSAGYTHGAVESIAGKLKTHYAHASFSVSFSHYVF